MPMACGRASADPAVRRRFGPNTCRQRAQRSRFPLGFGLDAAESVGQARLEVQLVEATMTKAQLAEWFTDKLLVDYYKWRLTLPKGSRRGIRYKGLITMRGGVGAMKTATGEPDEKAEGEGICG
jgi:hypothetical protein